jgi:signal transduction histidine kinase
MKEHIYDNNLDSTNLLESILVFINSINHIANTSHLIDESLKVLLIVEIVESAAFVRMDNQTFEFAVSTVYPKNTFNYFSSVLERISESGDVGIAFQSGNFFVSEDKINKKWNLLLPIFSSKNVIGLYILDSNEDFSHISIQQINLLILFSRTFGLALENKDLNSQKIQQEKLLDQFIASRTIELVENNQQLGAKIESLKSNLSMSIPHEVRTPINEIMGMNNYLKSYFKNYKEIPEEDRADILEIVDDVSASAKRLKNLFENFIYHTRLSIISTSIKEIEQLQSQICPYCDSVIFEQAELRAQQFERSDDIEVNLVSSGVRMSEEYLAKMIDELVDNAMKYSKKGDKVLISSSIQQQYYHLTIHDFGSGIPTEFLDQVDAYIQFDRKKHEQQGLGLGLAIIYKIIDLHNGFIEIDSKLNKYTKVMIKIPVATDMSF